MGQCCLYTEGACVLLALTSDGTTLGSSGLSRAGGGRYSGGMSKPSVAPTCHAYPVSFLVSSALQIATTIRSAQAVRTDLTSYFSVNVVHLFEILHLL